MIFAPPLSRFSVLFLGSAVLLSVVAGLVWRSQADTRVTDWFLVVLCADATWALASIVPLEAGNVTVAFVGEVFAVAASNVAAIAWFVFSFVYTGRDDVLTRPVLVVLLIPLLVGFGAFATAPFHSLAISDLTVTVRPTATLVTYEFAPLSVLSTIYTLLLVLTGTGLVAWTALTDPELYADQTVGLLVGALMPIAGSVLTVSGVYGFGNTNLTPATLGITAIGYGYALFRTDLLETGPAVAVRGEDIAIERLSEGFLVVDGRGIVVEANTAARDLSGRSGLTGQPVTAVLGTDRPLTSGQRLLRMDDGTVLEAQVTPMDDDEETGHVVTLRDVTARQRRQERLQVLNRVLRHNVRNNLDVVRGYARQIADGDTDHLDTPTAARRIAETADSLLETAKKARTVEELLDTDGDGDGDRGPPLETVDLSALLAERVEAKRSEGEGVETAEIRTTLPENCEIRSNRDVLRLVVDEVLDNAVRHTGDDATVRVCLSVESDVRVRIADDGPGIPEQERRAVLNGTGSPLDHASRFGLWMVRWGVLSLGGDFAIHDRSPTGTVVEVTLPG